MQVARVAVLKTFVFTLGACNPPSTPGGSATDHGRYVGVGIYAPGPGWARMVAPKPPTDPAAAHIADDEHVVVVVDSRTGEIRQCGDLSGYCVGMNPWSKALGASQTMPVRLAPAADQNPSTGHGPGSGQAKGR